MKPTEVQAQKFVFTFFVMLVTVGLLAFVSLGWSWVWHGADHWAAVTSVERKGWYRDLGGKTVTEIQDQELFYHNIGRSLEEARQADIIILGSSLAAFGFDGETLEQALSQRYGLKVYNMSFVGVSSGEFSKRIALKYGLHPRLWVITADDGGGHGHFFSETVLRSFAGDVKVIAATEETRIAALFNVARRNLRWRAEDLLAASPFGFLTSGISPTAIPPFYRETRTGAADMSLFPRFNEDGNARVSMPRSGDCQAAPEVIDIARRYVTELGGEVVLTLVPNMHGCRKQVNEIGEALGIEVVLPPRDDYSSWDNGGHLDHRGAVEMTREFVLELEQSTVFRQLVGNPSAK